MAFPFPIPGKEGHTRLILTCVYRPVKKEDKPAFDDALSSLYKKWGDDGESMHVVIGDFNGCLSRLDQLGEKCTSVDEKLQEMVISQGLQDTVRDRFPVAKLASRRGKRGEAWRTLDLVLLKNPNSLPSIRTMGARFIPSRSDHHLVVVGISNHTPGGGKQVLSRVPIGPLERESKRLREQLRETWVECKKCDTPWGAWEKFKRLASDTLRKSEREWMLAQPTPGITLATNAIAQVIDAFGEEDDLGEEWEEYLGVFEEEVMDEENREESNKK